MAPMRASTRATTEVWNREARPPSNENIETGEAFGPYVVYESLGAGGMASVHRAAVRFDAGFGKSIALKRLRPQLAADAAFASAFVREAELATKLRHDHIVQTYAHGVIGDTYYLAMELVPGPTLKQIMQQSRSAAGAIPIPVVIEILIQLCDALAYLHNARDDRGRPLSIIHRDVSPANVIVSSSGVVKLIDFGIAKDASPRARTRNGIVKGKLGYVAPEYTFGRLDSRADLFAVGVIAHELLTGQPLFEDATKYDTLCNLREKPIHPPSRLVPQISRELDDIVLTALQRDPALRWQNAAAMRFALREVARELGGGGPAAIRAWATWAFAREPRRDTTKLERMIDALERGSQDPVEPVALAAPAPAPAPRAPHRMDTQLVHRLHRGPSPWWLVLLVLAIAVAAIFAS
jgi:serine/threonine-protein kinase